ncbi:sperm flagellar protein 1 [Gouania willdenowi]|uniref:sperm flagellar protein 1 n=1 Tax=Gouania willdenowi TaxID=441366 RepID=UPI001055FDF8|nr:sperm flagellar protein 1 [Gouania willdenowi]
MDRGLSEEEMQDLFAWIDNIPLSRQKRNISRDFSDGVMAAEVVKHFFPKMVDLHNYVPANSTQKKISNWELLNKKVFPQLNFHVPESTVKKIALNTAGVILPVLRSLQNKINMLLMHQTDHTTDLKYYDTMNHENAPADTHLTKARVLPQLADMKTDEGKRHKMSKPQRAVNVVSDINPAFKQMLMEKEQTITTLQETVEILQMRVGRLEHLVHLKDMRIEDLNRHLEVYRSNDKPR